MNFKTLSIYFIFILSGNFIFSQQATVEKSIFGVQTGFLGVWINHEARLAPKFALRSEIGLEAGYAGGSFQNDVFFFAPTLKLEPRYYYNLQKRLDKGKSITKNSGNFFAINTLYTPDWFVISSESNLDVVETLSVIPKWGIRRVVGEHFTYEVGIGIGYQYSNYKQFGFSQNESDVTGELHLRIGYTF
ncbi:MAG: hypothetical protein CVT96_09160 [Bacteroidetes bacterium HGW-Bacteroidetes-13]|nr:MAG: hypothetical protein CVT96_09160 [Bacteroidetes bacterium HGW-Bacteroidetes-13]